jgi:metal-sulfur cluster biosynthetic enzyme
MRSPVGHNSTNKGCPTNIDLSDMIEDAVEEEMETSDTELEIDILENNAEEELVNIDELLDSDDDLY